MAGGDLLRRAPEARRLLATAERQGEVRVIVDLALEVERPGPDRVAEAQNKLLDEMGLFRVEVARRYTSVPQLALVVGPDALGYLLATPLIARVHPDLPDPPLGDPLPAGPTPGIDKPQ